MNFSRFKELLFFQVWPEVRVKFKTTDGKEIFARIQNGIEFVQS